MLAFITINCGEKGFGRRTFYVRCVGRENGGNEIFSTPIAQKKHKITQIFF